jgi:hypothetical protein
MKSLLAKKIMLPQAAAALFHLLTKNNLMRFLVAIYHALKVAGRTGSHG